MSRSALDDVRVPQEDGWTDPVYEVPVLCDVLGVIGSEILLGHWNSALAGD